MVLNVVDEIINGTPKYNITENSDGTKEIELANEIVQEGTKINRNLFNLIENVMSYQIPSVSQQSLHPDYIGNITPSSITPTWSSIGPLNTDIITFNYEDFGGIQPSLKYKANGYNFYAQSGSSSGSNTFVCTTDRYNTYYTSNKLLYTQQLTNNDELSTRNFLGRKQTTIEYDMGQLCIPTFDFRFDVASSSTYIISGSYDGVNWTQLHSETIRGYSGTFTPSTPYRYYQFKNNSYSIDLYYLFISKVEFPKDNVFTLGNETNFKENEIILINTPSNVVTTGVGGNTFNGVEIDSILEASKYYELVYNETQNKFIAEEVRNAN